MTGTKRRLIRGTLAVTYGKLAVVLVQLLLVPVMIHAWGLQLYGHWLLLATVPLFLGLSDLGFGLAAGNRIIGEVASGNAGQALATFQSAWTIVLASTATMLAMVLTACALAPEHWLYAGGGMTGVQAREVLAVLCAYGVVSLQAGLFAAVPRAMGKMALGTVVSSSFALLEGLAVALVVWRGGSPLQAAATHLVLAAIGVVAQALLARRLAPWLSFGRSHATRERMRELLRPALAAMLLPLAQAGYLQGAALAVGAAGGTAMVPVFTAVRTLSRLAMQVLATVMLPIMPEFTGAHAQGQAGKVRMMAGFVLLIHLVAGISFGVAFWLFGLPVIGLWTGQAVHPPQAMIAITALAILVSLLWNAFGNLLFALNRHGVFALAYSACAMLAIALTYMLVLEIGVTGAALAALLLDLVMLAVVARSLHRAIGGFDVAAAIRTMREAGGEAFGKMR